MVSLSIPALSITSILFCVFSISIKNCFIISYIWTCLSCEEYSINAPIVVNLLKVVLALDLKSLISCSAPKYKLLKIVSKYGLKAQELLLVSKSPKNLIKFLKLWERFNIYVLSLLFFISDDNSSITLPNLDDSKSFGYSLVARKMT